LPTHSGSCARSCTKASGAALDTIFSIKFVSHSDVELARNDGDIFRRRMILGRNLVVRRYIQPRHAKGRLDLAVTDLGPPIQEHRRADPGLFP
jgi:hypothetical protein